LKREHEEDLLLWWGRNVIVKYVLT